MVTATKQPSVSDTIRDLARLRPLTAEDLQRVPDDGNRYEIIGGHLIVSPSPSYRHQQVSFQLSVVLGGYIAVHGNAQAVAAPMDVYLSPNDVVQPDLLVVLNERAEIIKSRGITGAPDVVVEIISPSSMETDFLKKSKLYERFGVQEYWIVNPENQMVSVQTLDGDRFAIAGEYSRDDILTSQVLEGFELALSVLFPKETDESAHVATEEPHATDDE